MNDLNMIAGKRKLTKSELTKVLKFTGDYKRLREYYFLLGLSVVFIAANVAFILRAFTSDNSAFTFISGFIFSISIFINARNVKAFCSRVFIFLMNTMHVTWLRATILTHMVLLTFLAKSIVQLSMERYSMNMATCLTV